MQRSHLDGFRNPPISIALQFPIGRHIFAQPSSKVKHDAARRWHDAVRISIQFEFGESYIAGVVFSSGRCACRCLRVHSHKYRVQTTNEDVSVIIGTLGQTMCDYMVKIANFNLGRSANKGEANALLYIDELVPPAALKALEATKTLNSVKPLSLMCYDGGTTDLLKKD